MGRGAEPLSRGCSAPGTGSAAGELICLRELQHLEGLQIPCQNAILISLIRVSSDSIILFPKTLYREFQSFHDGGLSKESPLLTRQQLTCSQPTTGDRYQAPANKPLPPRQKPRKAASDSKIWDIHIQLLSLAQILGRMLEFHGKGVQAVQ